MRLPGNVVEPRRVGKRAFVIVVLGVLLLSSLGGATAHTMVAVGSSNGASVRVTSTETVLSSSVFSPRELAASVAAPSTPISAVVHSLGEGAGPAHGVSLNCSVSSESSAACGPSPKARPLVEQNEWNNETGALIGSRPAGVEEASLTWDAADGYYLMFGGCTLDACPSNETWVYSSGIWSNITADLTIAPSARYGAAMDFDYAADVVLLYGGCGAICPMNDTWTYSGGLWSNVTTSACAEYHCPTATFGSALTFDASFDDTSVLFGGCTDVICLGQTNQTAEYIEGYWYYPPIMSYPAARAYMSMVYDPLRSALVLFGGIYSCGVFSWCDTNDTWVYNESVRWEYYGSFTAPPSGRGYYQMTWDSQDQAVLLQGGYNETFGMTLNDTWEYQCRSTCDWYNVTPTAPSPAIWGGAVSSNLSGAQAPWFFGGYGPTGYSYSQWGWGTAPTMSLTGSPNPTEVDSLFWANATASGGVSPYSADFYFPQSSSYYPDEPLDVTVITPSTPGPVDLNCTVIDSLGLMATASIVEQVHPHPSPEIALIGGADAGFNATLVGSVAAGTGVGPFTYNWSFGDGSPSFVGPTAHHVFAHPGTYNVTLNVTDALVLYGTTHHNYNTTFLHVTVVAGPSVTGSGTPSTIDLGTPVEFTATGSGGSTLYTYAWNFGDGTNGSGASVSHTYTTSGAFHATVKLTDSAGGTATHTVNVSVNPALAVSLTESVGATTTNSTVNFSALASGGSGVYTYAWTFGDSSTASGAATSHAYVTSGTYTVSVKVTDSLGGTVTKSATVVVSKTPGSSSSSGFSLTSPIGLAIIGLVVVVVALLAVFLATRRRKPQGGAPQPWTAPPMAGASPSPPGASGAGPLPPPPPPGPS
jgi:PKD repeat protein